MLTDIFTTIADCLRRSLKKNEITAKAPQGTQPVAIRAISPISMLVIADLHTCSREDMQCLKDAAEEATYDCVLFLGDIMRDDILSILPHTKGKPCLYALGNHDRWDQNEGIPGLTNLDGKTVSVRGVRISGVSGAPRYKDGNFAMRTEEEMKAVLSGVGDTDILVSHESPWNLLATNTPHAGFRAISEFLERTNAPLHIFGHHHENWTGIYEATQEICVYKCALVRTAPVSVKEIL